jgi:hypothetical protein
MRINKEENSLKAIALFDEYKKNKGRQILFYRAAAYKEWKCVFAAANSQRYGKTAPKALNPLMRP